MKRFLCVAAWLVVETAAAQDYPVKPIRLIVPFGAGGGSDIIARTVAEELSKALGQAIVVEARPAQVADERLRRRSVDALLDESLVAALELAEVRETLLLRGIEDVPLARYELIRDYARQGAGVRLAESA